MRVHTSAKRHAKHSSPGLLVCYRPLAHKFGKSRLWANSYERWRFGFISNTDSTRWSVSRRRAAHCSLKLPQIIP